MPENDDSVERLPSFITGGQPQNPQNPPQGQGSNGPNGPNGPNGYDGSPDRYPLHRRRRRHRAAAAVHANTRWITPLISPCPATLTVRRRPVRIRSTNKSLRMK